jgi:hypothetical protein
MQLFGGECALADAAIAERIHEGEILVKGRIAQRRNRRSLV